MSPLNALPTGTITFLFTDIEGSTKLWETQPAAMQAALKRHDALLHSAIGAAGGVVFKTVGDAFCAAFASAPAALEAAMAAQTALLAEPWPAETPLRARMALHTGTVEERDEDYFGPPLNRVARLLSAGHGGQTLLSIVTQELCRDTLPTTVSLRDLGSHRLKDLERPEHIYQANAPGLPNTFAPLKTLDNTPNNLPQQLTSFVGREKAIADVTALLSKTRLLTLTGSGGSGKTRLSLQVAADVLDAYPDGAWQIELAPLSDPSLVPQAVASVLGVKEEAGQTLLQTLTNWLKDKTLLLLLDNCEHVVSSCAQMVAALLRSCPSVHVVATSREPLGISGETTYRVPSLSLPTQTQAKAATPDNLSQFEAVRLFIDRAQAVKTDFSVTNDNAPALAQLCFRLDGIPLALELAAARVRSLPVEQINDKLDTRFRLLTGGDKSALPRQPNAAGAGGLELRPSKRNGKNAACAPVRVRGRVDARRSGKRVRLGAGRRLGIARSPHEFVGQIPRGTEEAGGKNALPAAGNTQTVRGGKTGGERRNRRGANPSPRLLSEAGGRGRNGGGKARSCESAGSRTRQSASRARYVRGSSRFGRSGDDQRSRQRGGAVGSALVGGIGKVLVY